MNKIQALLTAAASFWLLLSNGDDKSQEVIQCSSGKEPPTYGYRNRCCQELGQSAVKPPGRWSLTAELEEGWGRLRRTDSAWILNERKAQGHGSVQNCCQQLCSEGRDGLNDLDMQLSNKSTHRQKKCKLHGNDTKPLHTEENEHKEEISVAKAFLTHFLSSVCLLGWKILT